MYFVFDRNSRPGRWIANRRGDIEGIDWLAWRDGVTLPTPIPEPLKFTLKPYSSHAADHAAYLPSYLQASCPIFRDDLVAALRESGVDNFDAYSCFIVDPDNGNVHTHYKAVNILGVIAAADMQNSLTIRSDGVPLIDVEFDRLVIDEKKTRGALLFRLAEATSTIVVHGRIRDHLIQRGFDDLAFYIPEQVAL